MFAALTEEAIAMGKALAGYCWLCTSRLVPKEDDLGLCAVCVEELRK